MRPCSVVALLPTPAKAGLVRESTIAALFKRHRIRRLTAADVLAHDDEVSAADWCTSD